MCFGRLIVYQSVGGALLLRPHSGAPLHTNALTQGVVLLYDMFTVYRLENHAYYRTLVFRRVP
jgi:hypothetical protein